MKLKIRRISVVCLLAFALAVTLFGPVVAMAASPGACYNVGDSDARSYCLAKARKEASQCYNIHAAGLRSMCLAEVRK